MSTLTAGDRTKLPGPRTVVRDEEKGIELYTEYHQADAGQPVYAVGKTVDAKADLLAYGVRDQVELAAAIAAAKVGKTGEVEPVEEPKTVEEVSRAR